MATKNEVKPIELFYTLIIFAGIIITTTGVIFLINSTEPSTVRESAVKRSAMLVEVEELQRGTFSPSIEGLGKVQPAQDIILSPRIDGQITYISNNFIPGSLVTAGEQILTLDPSDHQNNVKQLESALKQAKSTLTVEQGRLKVAEKEYALLSKELTTENTALILREPQMIAAKSAVFSAQAALDQAKLELERTVVKAPFHAQIIERNVSIGSQVDSNTELARLIGVDQYWVVVTVQVAQLRQIDFPENGDLGTQVIIRNKTWAEGTRREGRVVRLIGTLDPVTRLARIIVSIDDPLGLQDQTVPVIFVDSVVQAEIKGRSIENVFRIKRDYLHEGNTVWLNKEGELNITRVQVFFKDKKYAYVSEGLNDGDQLITSNLATVAQGIRLRTLDTNTGDSPVVKEVKR